MSASAVTQRPRRLFTDPISELGPADVRHLPQRSDGGRSTLGQKLDRVWEDLHAAGVAECAVCDGEMVAETRSCGACGTRLL